MDILEILDRYAEGDEFQRPIETAIEEITALRQRVQELEKELEVERMRLAACSTAALGYFDGCCDEYKSASLTDVLGLRKSNEKLTAERDELLALLESFGHKIGCRINAFGRCTCGVDDAIASIKEMK